MSKSTASGAISRRCWPHWSRRPASRPDLIKELAEAGDHFYLPLADGRHLSLAADRFLPLVLALHGLRLSGMFPDVPGKIKLSRADVVPLLGLENEKFAFRGAEQSSSSRGPASGVEI